MKLNFGHNFALLSPARFSDIEGENTLPSNAFIRIFSDKLKLEAINPPLCLTL